LNLERHPAPVKIPSAFYPIPQPNWLIIP